MNTEIFYSKAINRFVGTVALPVAKFDAVEGVNGPKETASEGRPTTSTISTLGRQLAELAERAAKRDATLSRSELLHYAKAMHEQAALYSHPPLKVRADSYVPDTSDPELIARAKQATDFVNGLSNVSNPFAELSRDQLYLIQYDDSKTFSINEREAAAKELGKRYGVWNEALFANYSIEKSATGRGTNFYKTILEDVKSLPPIARVFLPIDYEAHLLSDIAREERGGAPDDLLAEPFDLMAYLFPEGVEPDEKFRYYPLEPYDPGKSDAPAGQAVVDPARRKRGGIYS